MTRSTSFTPIVAGAAILFGTAWVNAEPVVLHFSGYYSSVTVDTTYGSDSEFGKPGEPNGTTDLNSNHPRFSSDLTDPSSPLHYFSGDYYFDDAAPGSKGNRYYEQYNQTNQGPQIAAYTTQDRKANTRSSFQFNVGPYRIASRRSDQSTDTFTVGNFPDGAGDQYFQGYRVGISTDAFTPAANYASSPILPLGMLGIDPNTQWYPYHTVYGEDGSVRNDISDPNADLDSFQPSDYFIIAVGPHLTFQRPAGSDQSDLGMPTPGSFDFSQFASATLSFETYNNTVGSAINYSYQDVLRVVGTITSATLTAVPEPSSVLLWGTFGVVGLAGLRLNWRTRRA